MLAMPPRNVFISCHVRHQVWQSIDMKSVKSGIKNTLNSNNGGLVWLSTRWHIICVAISSYANRRSVFQQKSFQSPPRIFTVHLAIVFPSWFKRYVVVHKNVIKVFSRSFHSNVVEKISSSAPCCIRVVNVFNMFWWCFVAPRLVTKNQDITITSWGIPNCLCILQMMRYTRFCLKQV